MTLALASERDFATRISSLEVLVRGGRLPPPYVRAICSLCLGFLHVKFKPFWEASIVVLVAAAGTTEGEAVLWPLLLEFIQSTGRLQMTAPEAEDSMLLEGGENDDTLPSYGINGGAIRAFDTLLHDSTGTSDNFLTPIINFYVLYVLYT